MVPHKSLDAGGVCFVLWGADQQIIMQVAKDGVNKNISTMLQHNKFVMKSGLHTMDDPTRRETPRQYQGFRAFTILIGLETNVEMI